MKAKIHFLFFILVVTSATLNAVDLKDYLIPVPKNLEQRNGTFNLSSGRIIIPQISTNNNLLNIGDSLQSLLSQIGINTSIAAKASKDETPLLWAYISPVLFPQAYKITIQPNQILLEGGDEAGLFYALQTFKQIVRYARDQGALPLISVEDEPDFQRRGIMLDISRTKVPSMYTLKKLVDLFASWKINELQLYTENTFAYQNHSVVWKDFSPMTAGDILELNQYCRERFIDLVPNQTSFGHMDNWLIHDQYKHLAEIEGPNPGHVMSPAVPGTIELMRELYAELLPNFSSKYFNINSDEVEVMGTGRTKELVDNVGRGRVYLDFVLQLKDEIDNHGRITQFWGDIILKHPELIPEIPKDMITLVWGYSEDHPFDAQCQKFHEAGSPFYVCPGTSSWNSLVGRNQDAFNNLKNAAMNGKKHGALGFLNTDWGDGGHWQPLPVSYPTYLFGAAISWGFEDNQQIDVGKLVSRYLFNDPTEKSGQALIEIGNAYLKTGVNPFNNSLFNNLLRSPAREIPKEATPEGLQAAIDYLDQNLKLLLNAPMACEDAQIVKAEMNLAVNMAKLGCRIGISRFTTSGSMQELKEISVSKRKALSAEYENIIIEHQKLWVLRNRPGGLHVSAGTLEKGLTELKK